MRIGVDFDNTIVCFDPVFHAAALERKLIPAGVAPTKLAVRAHLWSEGKEGAWTELQGWVYGDLIKRADPYPGVKEFFRKALDAGHTLSIISHKTTRAALGPPLDLHAAARAWLEAQGFTRETGLPPDRVFFETSVALKLDRIREQKSEMFIDDLLEVLTNPDFPAGVEKILFAPVRETSPVPFRQASSWAQIQTWIL